MSMVYEFLCNGGTFRSTGLTIGDRITVDCSDISCLVCPMNQCSSEGVNFMCRRQLIDSLRDLGVYTPYDLFTTYPEISI